jgi:glycosyltransferase involved in cell wall biosynthesis
LKILWIPHSWESGTKPRARYFIERLAERHTIHVVRWESQISRTVPGLVRSLRVWHRLDDGITHHHVPRLPLDYRDDGVPRVTQALFQRHVRQLVRQHEIDVVVCSCNWYALGFPPTDLPVPIVLDYFDILSDAHEQRYFAACQGVLCSSSVLFDRARKYAVPSFYLPNGVDTRLFRQATGAAVRREYDLGESRVVSLIGLTACPTLYFVDAINRVAGEFPDVKGLIVGDGPLRPLIEQAVRGRQERFRIVGPVSFERIPEFFAATDVGMYPGEIGPQFDAALPIKVLEYTAAAKPVVAPRLTELSRLNFPNVIFAEPTAEGFADGISRALRIATPAADLASFELSTLATTLDQILHRVVHSARGGLNPQSASAPSPVGQVNEVG